MATTTTQHLDVTYEEAGPADAPVALLLHGFPDDGTGWADVAAGVAAQGVRTVAPHLRGFGPTRLRDDDATADGLLATLVDDAQQLLDALGVERAAVVGVDWGARVAQGLAVREPERCRALVSLSGYQLSWDDDGFPPPPVLHALWYQWLLMTDLGEAVLRYDPDARDGLLRHLWDLWCPTWDGRAEAFEAVRPSFANPALADVVLSAYRERGGGELDDAPTVDVPTWQVLGAADGLEPYGPDLHRDRRFFADLRDVAVLDGVGHWPHREAPGAVAAAVVAAVGVSGQG